MIFANVEMLKNYVNDISTATYGNLLAEYNQTGFTSLIQASGSPISENQLIDGNNVGALLLSQDGIIEIAGTVFKYSESSPSFLTSPSSSISSATYEALKAYTFIPSSMNLINPSDNLGEGLFEFLASHPTGYTSSDPLTPQPQARKFIGKEDKQREIYNYDGTLLNVECDHTIYFFWFQVGESWTTPGPC